MQRITHDTWVDEQEIVGFQASNEFRSPQPERDSYSPVIRVFLRGGHDVKVTLWTTFCDTAQEAIDGATKWIEHYRSHGEPLVVHGDGR